MPPSLFVSLNPLCSLCSRSSSSPETKKPWDGVVKMPTAPWMRGPLLLPADQVLDLSKPKNKNKNKHHDASAPGEDRSLTERVKGGRSRHAMRHIASSIAKLRETLPPDFEVINAAESTPEFTLPLNEEYWCSAPTAPAMERRRAPWARAEGKLVFRREKKDPVPTPADLTLPEPVLTRLRAEARGMSKWVRAKKAGVTDEVVDEIRTAWRHRKLAMVKMVEPLCRNMDRAREIVEAKTGGLVVWIKKDALVVYRGTRTVNTFQALPLAVNDEPSSPQVLPEGSITISPAKYDECTSRFMALKGGEVKSSDPFVMDFKVQNVSISVNGTLYEREANRLLDSLGPRFIDWWWRKPLPVDADLLPEAFPGFRPPFRMPPPRVGSKLTDNELTYLRKLARPLPTHFALGKNTKLQGLADAIIRLWEKCLVAKIAVKVGIQNTNHKQMSWELKRLTGGTLILSNKFFIILYRGKDFVPGIVANLILERERVLQIQQLKEEEARTMAVEPFQPIDEPETSASTIGTFAEFQKIQENYVTFSEENPEIKVQLESEKQKLKKEIREQERKLLILRVKIERSEKEMAKLNLSESTSAQAADQELLTKEERQTLRRIGLKMDEVLLLGRRGIYDGVIGSIHQHWKFREVVKVITLQTAIQQINYSARLLEIESGGILVAVEELRKGHAIILYRGKNYIRPLVLLPENLLTKKQALERSIEIQRRGSLKYFAHQRGRVIWELKQRLRHVERKTQGLPARNLKDLRSNNYAEAPF